MATRHTASKAESHEGPVPVKLAREAVDAFAREVLDLTRRLRPVLEDSPTAWPAVRGRLAASISRDLVVAVDALDAAVEALYLQTESLESAHAALEVERRSYQELFEGGPDGYLVTDPGGVILRANGRAGALFRCSADDLVGELLTGLLASDDRASLQRVVCGFETGDREEEWLGLAVPAAGSPFQVALTAAVVRHVDGSVYRVRWSVRTWAAARGRTEAQAELVPVAARARRRPSLSGVTVAVVLELFRYAFGSCMMAPAGRCWCREPRSRSIRSA
jgi:PAS domain S-box-containing protein